MRNSEQHFSWIRHFENELIPLNLILKKLKKKISISLYIIPQN